MIQSAALMAILLVSPAARGPGGDDDAPASSVTRVLILPVQARAGGSAYLGQGLSDILADAMKHRDDVEVTIYDLVSVDMRDSGLGVLARCPEVRCAMEVGRREGMDEVVYGIIDGSAEPASLRIWRVDARGGVVLGMFSMRVTDASLGELTDHPERMVNALLDVPDAATPIARWQPVAVAAVARRDGGIGADKVGHRREILVRSTAGLALGAGGVGLLLGMTGVVAYGLLVAFNVLWTRTSGINAVPFLVGAGLDVGGIAALGGLLLSIPLLLGALVALLIPARMLGGRKE